MIMLICALTCIFGVVGGRYGEKGGPLMRWVVGGAQMTLCLGGVSFFSKGDEFAIFHLFVYSVVGWLYGSETRLQLRCFETEMELWKAQKTIDHLLHRPNQLIIPIGAKTRGTYEMKDGICTLQPEEVEKPA